MARKSREEQYEQGYGKAVGPAVLRSIAKVARAGRTGDPDKIEAERARHYAFMASLP